MSDVYKLKLRSVSFLPVPVSDCGNRDSSHYGVQLAKNRRSQQAGGGSRPVHV